MAIDLSERDHDLLNKFLDSVLQEHKRGQCDLAMARSVLARAFAIVARGEAGFRDYMEAMLE